MVHGAAVDRPRQGSVCSGGASFDVEHPGDTFLDLRRWGKGVRVGQRSRPGSVLEHRTDADHVPARGVDAGGQERGHRPRFAGSQLVSPVMAGLTRPYPRRTAPRTRLEHPRSCQGHGSARTVSPSRRRERSPPDVQRQEVRFAATAGGPLPLPGIAQYVRPRGRDRRGGIRRFRPGRQGPAQIQLEESSGRAARRPTPRTAAPRTPSTDNPPTTGTPLTARRPRRSRTGW